MKIIFYTHKWINHEAKVAVIEANKGKHRDNCLCFQGCGNYRPGTPAHCPIAQALFEFDVEHDLTTPVWECPEYTSVAYVQQAASEALKMAGNLLMGGFKWLTPSAKGVFDPEAV
jgi:hypothetical protein